MVKAKSTNRHDLLSTLEKSCSLYLGFLVKMNVEKMINFITKYKFSSLKNR